MKFGKRKEKTNNSIRQLLGKLKRHDTMVVAIAVVIALLLCGGLIYLSTPVVAASATEDLVKSEQESNQQTAEKLQEIHDYLSQLDKVVTDNQKSLKSINENTTNKETENNTVIKDNSGSEKIIKDTEKIITETEKISNTIKERMDILDKTLETIHTDINRTFEKIESVEELIKTNDQKSTELITKGFADISAELDKIQKNYKAAQQEMKGILADVKKTMQEEHAAINENINSSTSSINNNVNEKSEAINNNVDSSTSSINSNVNSKASDINKKIDEKSSQINNNINEKSDSINTNINTQSENITENINNKSDSITKNINNKSESISEKIDSQTTTLNQQLDSKYQAIAQTLSQMITSMEAYNTATLAAFSRDITNLSNNLDKKLNNINSNIDSVNNTINAKFDSMNNSVESDFSELKEFVGEQIGDVNRKIGDFFTSVSEGKRLLASTLLTKGVKIRNDASFLEISKAIESIKTVIIFEEIPGEITYERHYHKDGKGNDCQDETVSEDRMGGCFTKPSYHKHNDSCYEIKKVYRITVGDADFVESTSKTNEHGEQINKYKCRHCGYSFEGTNSSHDEEVSTMSEVNKRNPISYKEVKKKTKVCKKKEKELDGYTTSCGFLYGQIISAHVDFIKGQKTVQTSNVATRNKNYGSAALSRLIDEDWEEEGPEVVLRPEDKDRNGSEQGKEDEKNKENEQDAGKNKDGDQNLDKDGHQEENGGNSSEGAAADSSSEKDEQTSDESEDAGSKASSDEGSNSDSDDGSSEGVHGDLQDSSSESHDETYANEQMQ